MNPLEFDVKRALATSPNAQLQWYRIRDELFKKYQKEYNDKDSFTTILHRKLQKMSHIEKKSLGHQKVFYYIPKKNLKKVREEIDREIAHRQFDEIWSSFTPEQRKRELINLLNQRIQPILILQNLALKFSSIYKDQIEEKISELENPTDDLISKYSLDKRKQLLTELHNIRSEFEKIQSTIIKDKQYRINEKELETRMKLIQDFTEKIVVPRYSGMWQEAIWDLMQKAVEEQNKIEESS